MKFIKNLHEVAKLLEGDGPDIAMALKDIDIYSGGKYIRIPAGEKFEVNLHDENTLEFFRHEAGGTEFYIDMTHFKEMIADRKIKHVEFGDASRYYGPGLFECGDSAVKSMTQSRKDKEKELVDRKKQVKETVKNLYPDDPDTCPECSGSGVDYGETCLACGGSGKVYEHNMHEKQVKEGTQLDPCPECGDQIKGYNVWTQHFQNGGTISWKECKNCLTRFRADNSKAGMFENLADFEKSLGDFHDPYYEFSDDHKVWTAGRLMRNNVRSAYDKLGDEDRSKADKMVSDKLGEHPLGTKWF